MLAGLRVILTRPRHQCDTLIEMLNRVGAEARCLPVIDIEPPRDADAAVDALERFGCYDVAIFTSANAVSGALSLKPDLPEIAHPPEVAAVGPATRRALERAGVDVNIVPETHYSSEGLLSHPRFEASAVRGNKVLIVKGEGGRGLLAEALGRAGATVAQADVYRRSQPEVRISELLPEPLSGFDLIVITSGTAIEHLLDVASEAERRQILAMPMLVSSERIAAIARHRGVRQSPLVAEGPEDEALVRAVENWRRTQPGASE
ncbi:MAG: uroporphyrinogen-III synthase [Gammaproteobacteria bacterium]|nr:uroporphyrinogen-III synthase [Gammaproteobacteria bacterium]